VKSKRVHNPKNYCYRYFTKTINQLTTLYMKKEDQHDATIRCLLLMSVSTCFGHHYAHLQENKGLVTAFGVLFWFCWMWLVAVMRRCLAGHYHYEDFCSTQLNKNLHSDHVPQDSASQPLPTTSSRTRTTHQMQ